MLSISSAGVYYVDVEVNRRHLRAFRRSVARVRRVVRGLAVVLGAASLAACAQSSAVTRYSDNAGYSQNPVGRQASLETHRAPVRRVAAVKRHTPFASRKSTGGTQTASQ